MSRGRLPIPASYTESAIDRFRNWPLTVCRADSPPGRALALAGRQIVHFHRADLAEVRLTRALVQRLTPALAGSGCVDVPPNTSWIRIRLDADSDLSLLESLVSLAIQANDPALPRSPACCPHSAVLLRRPARAASVIPLSGKDAPG